MLRTALLLCLVGCAVDDVDAVDDIDISSSPLSIGPTQPPPQGRAAIWGFVPNTATTSRFWLDHGPNELPELTGPNDRQLVGDFFGKGHDQVLFLNYWGGTRRAVIADFWSNPTTPTLLYEEPWGNATLDGWDDRQQWDAGGFGDPYADDVALVGDFLNLEHDQLLLLNRQRTGGRMKIIDYASGSPQPVYEEIWGGPGIPDQFSGAYDDLLAGDFMGRSYDQLMMVNTDDLWSGAPRVIIRDFSAGRDPAHRNEFVDRYSDSYATNYAADLRPRPVTKRFAGDFLGLGHDQVLYLNPTGSGTRIWIHDYANGLSTPWWENYADNFLLNGWHDDNDWIAVGDFAGNLKDQLLFMNRDGVNGRVMLVDFTIGQPARSLRTDSWTQPSPLNGWQDDNDLYMAGRFTPGTSDGLLTFNNFFISTRQDYRFVTTVGAAIALLDSHYTGIIDFDQTRSFDFTGHAELTVRSGITLRGGRGGLAPGALLYRDDLSPAYLFEVRGSDVAIENLRLKGSAFGRRAASLPHQGGIGIRVEPTIGLGKNVRVSGCELNEWLGKAIGVSGPPSLSREYVDEADKGWPRQGKNNANWVQVTNNFIHHNAKDDAGYGVLIEGGAYATIERNLFDYNRHAISGNGYTYSGFVARYNFVQEGGFTQDGYWNQHFDMHGIGDDGRGGPGGEYMDVSYNTFRGEQTYYVTKTRPAFMVRGTPSDLAYVHHNVWVHDPGEAVRLDDGDIDWPIIDDEEINNVIVSNDNRWNTDYVADLGAGDFDGDGTADVFVGTGTSWWYSSGGVTEWRYLNAASETSSQLAFANLDGDTKTDVIKFDPSTYKVLYSSGGTGPWTYVTISPQPLSELRFADFNGDGYADIFRTYQWKWWIMDGKTKLWANVNSASNPITELRFGQFDDSIGDDVVGVVGTQWMYSSSARSYWTPLNGALVTSLASTVVADFVGDGKSDIAYRSGSKWVVSTSGRTGWSDLRVLPGTTADYHPNLTGLLFGNFDRSDATVEAVTFERRYRFDIERGGWAYHPGPYFKRWNGALASQFVWASALPMM